MKGYKMARSVQKMLVLAVSIVFGAMLFAGCEEEQNLSDTTPGAKQSRLIAVENSRLKKQIEQLKIQHAREMESQKKLHTKENDRQERLLDNCLREKAAMGEISTKGVESYMQDVVGPLSEENITLQGEVKTLKAQVEKLKTELDEAKK
jgi:outer membrane murein-binding lipoprotein Lpp